MNKIAIIGTIVEAGNDEEGQARIIIQTEEAELRKLRWIPFYRTAIIEIKPTLINENDNRRDNADAPEEGIQ